MGALKQATRSYRSEVMGAETDGNSVFHAPISAGRALSLWGGMGRVVVTSDRMEEAGLALAHAWTDLIDGDLRLRTSETRLVHNRHGQAFACAMQRQN